MEPWAAPPEYFEQLEKSVREAAQDVINRALLKLKTTEEKTLKITGAVIQRPPREAIVEEAEKWGADLIHHAKCSVEIVRKSQPQEDEKT